MKLKLAVAAFIAALVLPTAPAMADEAIRGTCYDITIPFGITAIYECECLAGVQDVSISPPPPTVTVTVCHAAIDR